MISAPLIRTDRLFLRPPAPDDATAFVDFYDTDRAVHVGGRKLRSEAWRGFAHLVAHWQARGYGLFSVCRQGVDAALGLVGPWFPDGWHEREIGWLILDEAAEGEGIAEEAARAARDWAYSVLNWTTAVSYIAPENNRSIRLAERLGAILDPNASHSFPDPCLIFRHPAPEGAA